MPILIRELVIKAKVETDAASPAAVPRESGDGGSVGALTAERVARILADRQER